jgi:hypothetical protein
VTTPGPDGLVDVHVVGFPLDVYAAASEHHEALTREFRLVAYGERQGTAEGSVPARLLTLVDELTGRYAGLTGQQDATRDRARAEGRAEVDLHFRLPPDVREACLALGSMLDEADEFCRSGDLLTLATPPELVLFRRWYLGEFVCQIDGEPPEPWRVFRDRHASPVAESATGRAPGTSPGS